MDTTFSGVLILRQTKEVEQKWYDLFAEGLGNRRVSGVYTSIYLLWLENMAHNSHLFWSLNSPLLELSKVRSLTPMINQGPVPPLLTFRRCEQVLRFKGSTYWLLGRRVAGMESHGP